MWEFYREVVELLAVRAQLLAIIMYTSSSTNELHDVTTLRSRHLCFQQKASFHVCGSRQVLSGIFSMALGKYCLGIHLINYRLFCRSPRSPLPLNILTPPPTRDPSVPSPSLLQLPPIDISSFASWRTVPTTLS